MRVHVCPNRQTNINSKIGRKRSFSFEIRASIDLSLCGEWICVVQSLKKRDYYVNLCLSNWNMNFNTKNGRKKCFSIETKASISFTPMRGMCLWCLIIKRKEIIMWIRVCPDRRTNINSKIGRKRSVSYETKASIHLSLCEEWISGVQSLKKGRLLWKSVFIQLKNEL